MKKSVSLLLSLTILFIIGTHSGTINVQLVCQQCTVSCAYANCFRVTSDGYDSQQCGQASCVLNNSFNVTVSQCTLSSSGSSCTTGLCFFSGSVQGCLPLYTSSSSCSV